MTSTLGSAHLARLLAWHRPRRGRDAPPGVRLAADAVRRPRLARDLLHDWDGALAYQRDGHGLGADAVARDPAGGVGDVVAIQMKRLFDAILSSPTIGQPG